MSRRKISRQLQAWIDDYTATFHGIEPIMGKEELEDGSMSVREYKAYNLRWITEHTQEQVQRLERL